MNRRSPVIEEIIDGVYRPAASCMRWTAGMSIIATPIIVLKLPLDPTMTWPMGRFAALAPGLTLP
jgi:hypothetical protein